MFLPFTEFEYRDGLLCTAPIRTAENAARELEYLMTTIGYRECQGDLWLGRSLDRVIEFLRKQ